MTTPRTAAGRALLNDHLSGSPLFVAYILAIEAEARAAALDEAESELRNVRRSRLVGHVTNRRLESGPEGHLLDLTEALAAIDALRERSGE